jgi:hypothetical protein
MKPVTAWMPQSDIGVPGGLAPNARIGDWMQTFSGRAVYPMDLRPEDVAVEDIAHSLAMQCRFNGHCRSFYSVAEHSVLVSRWLREHYGWQSALAGLLHDASEAYLTDVPRPIKPFLYGYKEAEAKACDAIARKFGLTNLMTAEVREADNRILFDEKLQNMGNCELEWDAWHDPLGVTLQFWSPMQAEQAFLCEYWSLIEAGRL